jgi:hypothetical protein
LVRHPSAKRTVLYYIEPDFEFEKCELSQCLKRSKGSVDITSVHVKFGESGKTQDLNDVSGDMDEGVPIELLADGHSFEAVLSGRLAALQLLSAIYCLCASSNVASVISTKLESCKGIINDLASDIRTTNAKVSNNETGKTILLY